MEFRKLKQDEIEVRISLTKEGAGVSLLLYKTARTDMDLLDETVGPENWVTDYKEIKGNLYCGIGIRKDEEHDFIWKWNCGIESREDGEGNEKKGEASDAFKRAGFCWGIGRELYSAPFIWVNHDLINWKKNKIGKEVTNDKFFVHEITYDKNGKIENLAIKNQDEKLVFVHCPSKKKAEAPKAKKKEAPKEYKCCECGKPFVEFTDKNNKVWTAEEQYKAVVSVSTDGKARCSECRKKREAAKNEEK